MSGTDDDGFERSLRLFPFRSGVAVPDWIITGPEADTRGAGGLLGAGYEPQYDYVTKLMFHIDIGESTGSGMIPGHGWAGLETVVLLNRTRFQAAIFRI